MPLSTGLMYPSGTQFPALSSACHLADVSPPFPGMVCTLHQSTLFAMGQARRTVHPLFNFGEQTNNTQRPLRSSSHLATTTRCNKLITSSQYSHKGYAPRLQYRIITCRAQTRSLWCRGEETKCFQNWQSRTLRTHWIHTGVFHVSFLKPSQALSSHRASQPLVALLELEHRSYPPSLPTALRHVSSSRAGSTV